VSTKAIHPLYVDGPLKGQDFAVPGGSRHVQAVDYGGEPWNYDVSLTGQVVTYHLRQFAFRSGGGTVMLWVGCSQPGEPDADVLADLLLSDAAKAARCD
jgi:hypothetical protein